MRGGAFKSFSFKARDYVVYSINGGVWVFDEQDWINSGRLKCLDIQSGAR